MNSKSNIKADRHFDGKPAVLHKIFFCEQSVMNNRGGNQVF